MEIETNLLPPNERKEKPEDVLKVAFGTIFTDHMFSMDFSNGIWQNPQIHAYAPLRIDPAALFLHYGQGIFEGMKAYRRNNRVLLFRPEENINRLNKSAKRMVMPQVDSDFVLDSLKQLIDIERSWVPTTTGSSLYIRPTMIATEAKLGVRPSNEYLFFAILSPVGPYFREGFSPVKIMVAENHVRAAQGGVGAAKTAGNYAASLQAETDASKIGYSQVLWLDAAERTYLEEVGTMNIFVKFDDELVTPPLSTTILAGITRNSVLHIARDWGLRVNERKVSIAEIIEGLGNGKVEEMFGCGTAAIIAPVGALYYQNKEHFVSKGKIGALTQRLFDEITGIQSGERDDPYGWVVEVP
ncbi:MAG: branched-chain amino acid aminotransferase [Candidatus Thorarchaeota archaeon]